MWRTRRSSPHCAWKIGTVRERFFASQVSFKHSQRGDFLVAETYTVEIGENKDFTQIKDIPKSFIAADEIEIGFKNKIPLWLFGCLH